MNLAALEEKLANPVWRICSGELYSIKTADGRGIIPFHPRKEQIGLLMKLLGAIEDRQPGEERPSQFVELKARRLGYSTAIGVFIADCLAFRKSFTATLIDQTGDDAKKKMNDIVKVAIRAIRALFPYRLIKDNDSELSITLATDREGKNVSTFYAGTRARGGSNNFLWASELGVIQFDDPPRADEIITGAFPSARHGIKVVETTWKGGKGGKLYEMIQPTINGTADDWDVSFSPWYLDPRNVSTTAAHDAESIAYFEKVAERLDREGISLSDEQQRWWAAERRTLGIFMARENPTFLDECWTVPIPGSVYAAAVERARAEGRIAPMPIDGSSLVSTAWDLGAPQNTKVWYFQVVGREVRFIDYDGDFSGTLTERVAMMIAKGYNFGAHFFPHDVQQTERTGTTMLTEIQKSGLPGKPIVVPRTHSAWVGINHMLELFPALAFRSPQCDAGLDGLSAYRTKRQGEGALTTDEPVHDWASHVADAVRVFAEGHRAGLWQFKNTTAEVKADWYGLPSKRRGMKQQRVS